MTARQRYLATVSVYTTGTDYSGDRRCTMHSTSPDLLEWEKPWYVLRPDDRIDPGQTQFYAMCGYLQCGDLLIGLVKVLHDDWKAPGTPDGAFGVVYTTLAWSRDGKHWSRDLEPSSSLTQTWTRGITHTPGSTSNCPWATKSTSTTAATSSATRWTVGKAARSAL